MRLLKDVREWRRFMKRLVVNDMKKLKTHDIANIALIHHKDEIHKIWKNNNRHNAFVEFREIVKRVITRNYGKRVLVGLSNQFIGYAAHYIYAYCNDNIK